MAPIRRYLRITQYSVLEVRIYLHKPSDVAWLLSSRDNVLQRIIQEVRPKVLPKLREENENAKKKGGKKKKGIKDVASQEDFEVGIFLKETATRHTLLTKQKTFGDKPRLRSNGKGLTGWLAAGDKREDAIRIEDEEKAPEVLQEDDDVVELKDIPEASKSKGKKRKPDATEGEEGEDGGNESDALFVSSSDEEFFATQRAKPPKRRRKNEGVPDEPPPGTYADPAAEEDDLMEDDKKKMALNTSYDGFSIYGRILCLIVTRKGKREKGPSTEMMEQWIGTQAAQEQGLEDYEG